MDQSEYFGKVVDCIAKVMGLTPDDVLCGKRTDEVVDARWIIAQLLYEQGYHTRRIALFLSMSQRNVTHIITVFPDKLRNNIYNRAFIRAYNSAKEEVRYL